MDKDFILVGEGKDAKFLPVGALTVDQLTGKGDLKAALAKMGDLGKWLTNYSNAGYTYNQNNVDQKKNYEGLARMVAGNYGDIASGSHVRQGAFGPYIGGSPTFSNLRASSDGKVILDFVYGNNYEDANRHHTGYIYSDDNGQTWNVVTNFENPFAEGGNFYKWKETNLANEPDDEWSYAKANQVIFYPTNKFRFNNALGSAPYFEMEDHVKRRNKGYTPAQFADKYRTYLSIGEKDVNLSDSSGYRPAAQFASRIYTTYPSGFRYGGRLEHSNFYKKGGRLNYFNIYGRKN